MSRCFTGPNDLGTWRLIAKGVDAVGPSSEVDSAAFNLQAGETVSFGFAVHTSSDNNNDLEVYTARTATDVDVFTVFDTSASPAKVIARMVNNNGARTVNITWSIWGVIPP